MSNKRSKNLGIFKEDYKTLSFLWKKNQELFVWTNNFDLKVRDGINEMVENHVKFDCVSNLSKKERTALIKLIAEKNKIQVINDTDKHLGPAKCGQM